MAKADKAAEQEMTPEERDKRLGKAYTTATQELRKAHRDEFNDLYQKYAAEAGVEWSPRLTPEQKAEQEFDRLVTEYPHLAERFAQQEQNGEQ